MAKFGKARTVIYCHGINDKPPEKELKSIWDHSLFGFDQGERTRMAYWVDRDRYPSEIGIRSATLDRASATLLSLEAEHVLQQSVAQSDNRPASEMLTISLQALMKEQLALEYSKAQAKNGVGIKRVEVKTLWNPATEIVTKLFLADVNDFLFNQEKRDRMVQTVKNRMLTGGGPFVVIGHSQGSMVTYQALMEMGKNVEVDLFVTLGSPLGLPQVTDVLKDLHKGRLPFPSNVKKWVNVSRAGDIVCSDKTLSDDYKDPAGKLTDILISDFALFPRSHDVTHYLSYQETRKAVQSTVDKSRFQQVSPFTVARDLTAALDEAQEERVPVLIELTDRHPKSLKAAPDQQGTLHAAKINVLDWIDKNIGKSEPDKDKVQLEILDRYVSLHLLREEVEKLSADLGQSQGNSSPGVYRMYRNSEKRALIHRSANTIQASTARMGYNATGKGITWAVLDTGIDQKHKHFSPKGKPPVIGAAWDCTKRGSLVSDNSSDPNGHGTHVSGIIAGQMEKLSMISVAPETRLISYKVLGDDGSGNDAWIIKAIDHIWATNDQARRLLIHGVNLSLGGSFDASSFGCGDSPLCSSLLRLFRQGVLVVLAAGNEGSGEVIVDGYATNFSRSLSIGDPANLDEAIVVGSVHPTLPHRYGTSYFSSRGPTADGRLKPDVVAPGEKIWSCRSGGGGKHLENLYIELSGTSMAAPHVSGLLAAFLSVRTEFIGYPDRVKPILLENCTDLKRNSYHQGAGLPNLCKMLLNT